MKSMLLPFLFHLFHIPLSHPLCLSSVQSPGAGAEQRDAERWGELQGRALAASQLTGSQAVGSAPTSAQASGTYTQIL